MDARLRWVLAWAALSIALVMTVSRGGVGAGVSEAAGPCTVGSEVQLDADEQAFLVLINNYRAQNGLGPLRASYMLTRSSAWKSKDMGVNAYFAHNDTPIARDWYQRTVDCGYSHNTYVGENIAAGYANAQDVFNGWKNSPGHNQNMLGSSYTVIGIGKAVVPGSPYGTYWTTVFGGFDDGWAKTGPESFSAVGMTTADHAERTVGLAVSAVPGAPAAGGGGRYSRALDFSRICVALRAQRSPLADLLCKSSTEPRS